MHFSNACTHERCLGYWAIRIDEGPYGDVPLSGLKAFIAFDSPQHMIEGNWTEVVIIDEAATAAQRVALETILHGRAGGSWGLLAKFVSRWLDTRFLPIEFTEEPKRSTRAFPGCSTPRSPTSRAATAPSRSSSRTSSTRSTRRGRCSRSGDEL